MSDKALTKEQILADREILAEKYKTASKKVNFVNEVKNGLGVEIKKNPKPKIIKKTFSQKLVMSLRKIFTKF